MLKFLRFNIGGYFGGWDEVRLWVYKNSAKYEILLVSESLMDEISNEIKDYDLRRNLAELKGITPENYGADAPAIPKTNKRFPVKNLDRLSEWDSLGVNSWKDNYFEPCCDGTQWELTYREEGKEKRRVSGSNDYPPNWEQFIRWIDEIMPEMKFAENILVEDEYEDDEDD